MAAMTEAEAALVDCYRALRRTLEKHRGDLAPFQERNALKALACLWQIADGLDLEPEQLYELGC